MNFLNESLEIWTENLVYGVQTGYKFLRKEVLRKDALISIAASGVIGAAYQYGIEGCLKGSPQNEINCSPQHYAAFAASFCLTAGMILSAKTIRKVNCVSIQFFVPFCTGLSYMSQPQARDVALTIPLSHLILNCIGWMSKTAYLEHLKAKEVITLAEQWVSEWIDREFFIQADLDSLDAEVCIGLPKLVLFRCLKTLSAQDFFTHFEPILNPEKKEHENWVADLHQDAQQLNTESFEAILWYGNESEAPLAGKALEVFKTIGDLAERLTRKLDLILNFKV